ncbi:MAG: CoA-binding protein [Holophagaceae bacterium]|nr:CoA-binding protein [Holophagaceae bacterium]
MNTAACGTGFLHEGACYGLLARAGLHPPRHGWLGKHLPFAPGESVVVKGIAEGLWHKSELGAVRFLRFESDALASAWEEMRIRVEAEGYPWIGALVCERIQMASSPGLPAEGFAALTKGEGGWTLVLGLGGMQADALGALAPPLRWPMAFVDPQSALRELEAHLLGQVWLGTLRGTKPLTTRPQLLAFLEGLWTAAELAESEGLDLLELNPVALDLSGDPRPLDGVGRGAAPRSARPSPPRDFLEALKAPKRIAVAGVSGKPDGAGRIIIENLRKARLPEGDLLILRPGETRFLDLPCLPDAGALLKAPVDLLVLALPAASAVESVEALISQGGGASVVALVAGGLGDGADTDGLGGRLMEALNEARREGRWTPALLGPNFLGHVVPVEGINTTFIPADKWTPPPGGGSLALLSQSGAFLLSRLSGTPQLPLALAVALGNQLDLRLPDLLQALEADPEIRSVAAYVEGFAPGDLEATAFIAARMKAAGRPLWIYRAGRTEAGLAAAASHTGALAGDRDLEQALLTRAGARIAPTIAAFDAGLAWLGSFPGLKPGPVAVLTNAGFESVAAGDLMGGAFPPAVLSGAEVQSLREILRDHKLENLVSAQLPLDITPMADEAAYRAILELMLQSEARVVVVGLVPFTRKLELEDAKKATAFAQDLKTQAERLGKAVALVVDAGAAYDPMRKALAAGGLPVFTRMEAALEGLKALD